MPSPQRSNRVAIALSTLLILMFAGAAFAENWYLMAADVKVIGDSQAASVMSKGSMVGPVHFASQGEFNSRAACEADRHKLIHDWRKHSIIAHGGWAKHGITTPNAFAQCISAGDPRLVKASAGADVKAAPTMDILLHARRHLL
jgi:hypothetical protein